jgi:heme/copper-type cytochrome/quinol oxidase subunit 3
MSTIDPAATTAGATGRRAAPAGAADRRLVVRPAAFHVAWGKAMMWIFLLSDTFIFGCFLTGYMTVRASTTRRGPTRARCSRCTSAGATCR